LAAVFAEQHAVADFHVHGQHFAFVVALAWANGQDFTLIRLFSGCIRDHDARGSFGFAFDTFDDHAIAERTQFHWIS
jgi:hypothetical protein